MKTVLIILLIVAIVLLYNTDKASAQYRTSNKFNLKRRTLKAGIRTTPTTMKRRRDGYRRYFGSNQNSLDLKQHSDPLNNAVDLEQRFDQTNALTNMQNDVIPGESPVQINIIDGENGPEVLIESLDVANVDLGLNEFEEKKTDSSVDDIGIEIVCETINSSLFCRDVKLDNEAFKSSSDKDKEKKTYGKAQNSPSLDSQDSLQSEGSGEMEFADVNSLKSSERSGKIVNMFVDNENDPSCTTPKGENGRCRPAKRCILHEILTDPMIIIQYTCIRSAAIGFCCPNNPVIEVVNPDYDMDFSNGTELFQPDDGCGLNTRTRIVGGTVSKPHEWTWMVALLRKNRFFCGGVLVNNWYVLTAAHCTLGKDIQNLTVRLGEHDFNSVVKHKQDIAVSEIKRHAKFTSLTFQHDIALLKLRRPVEFSRTVKTVCLPEEGNDYSNVYGTVVGWGTVSFGGNASPILRQVSVPIWKNSQCDRTYLLEKIDDSFMCAGSGEDEGDACQGDSGGPLMTLNENGRWEVIGLVSWGRSCGDPSFPGVYTRVTTYLGWINENMK